MFAVLDRLPLAEVTRDEAIQLYWLMSSLLARPVAQKITGQMFFDVTDTGAKLKPGSGIRPTVTNVDLRFHNDNSYNQTPPDYVCLLCLHPAQAGRHQPGDERRHRPRGVAGALSRADAAALPAVLVRPPRRASRRRTDHLCRADLRARRGRHDQGTAGAGRDPCRLRVARRAAGQRDGRCALGRAIGVRSTRAACRAGLRARARSSTSTTGRRATRAPSSSIIRSPSANAIWCACGCATRASAATAADSCSRILPRRRSCSSLRAARGGVSVLR